jgi:phosphate transport system protein
MNRTALDHQLSYLKQTVNALGRHVDTAMLESTAILQSASDSLALTVNSPVEQIHRERLRIENMTATLITLHQPTLGDLRAALGAMNMATNLEHIGNLARHNARLASQFGEAHTSDGSLQQSLTALTAATRTQVQAALVAYEASSVRQAVATQARNEEVGRLSAAFITSCRSMMREHPERLLAGADLLCIAQNLRTMAEHAATLCEHVIAMATGYQPDSELGLADEEAVTKRRATPASMTQPLTDSRVPQRNKAAAPAGVLGQPAALQRMVHAFHTGVTVVRQVVQSRANVA